MYKAIKIRDTICKILILLTLIVGITFSLNEVFAQQTADDIEYQTCLYGNSTAVCDREREARLSLQPETEKDDPNVCFTCSMVITYANLSNEYVRKLSDAVLPSMQIMFGSLVAESLDETEDKS